MNKLRVFTLALVVGVLGVASPALAVATTPADITTAATSAIGDNAGLLAGLVVGAIAGYALMRLAWSGFKIVGKVITKFV